MQTALLASQPATLRCTLTNKRFECAASLLCLALASYDSFPDRLVSVQPVAEHLPGMRAAQAQHAQVFSMQPAGQLVRVVSLFHCCRVLNQPRQGRCCGRRSGVARAELKEKLDSVEGKVRAPDGCCSVIACKQVSFALCALALAKVAWACLSVCCSPACSCCLLRANRD